MKIDVVISCRVIVTVSRHLYIAIVCFGECFTDFKMSEVVTGVVKLTFCFLADKIRSGIAQRLKDGDVTDEQCRRLIVTELDDIKSKLDGLARKDLLSSLCFLQEGINRLNYSLLENTTESTEQATLVEATSSRNTRPNSPINEAIPLVNAITSLKIRSKDRFESAMKSFELARENATEAFCNEALSIEDRNQASQIRMMARILENLEDPDASVNDCLQYLKQLHDIGAIQEIFSVLINGGIKSRFNKKKRRNNASSVQVMNQTVFEFARKFTKSSLLGWLSQWPLISLGEESYHPVCGEDRHVGKLKESGLQVMSLCLHFTFDERIYRGNAVINSKGEIIALTRDAHTFKIFKRSGESRTLCEVPRKESASTRYVCTMDIDADYNIYVTTAFQESDDELWSFKLLIFDKNGNKKLEPPLPFLQDSSRSVRMAINKDGKIAILNCGTKVLYIGNVCIELNSFKVDNSLSLNELSIQDILSHVKVWFSDFNGTKVVAADDDTVYISTENGQLQRKIKIPEGHGSTIYSVAIDHVTKRILVKTYKCLLSFSETGELNGSLSLESCKWTQDAKLTSHPNGPVAVLLQP